MKVSSLEFYAPSSSETLCSINHHCIEEKLNQQLTQEQLVQEISKRITRIRSYTPKVGVFGNSGVGKSSLCNALFGKEVAKISDVEACTRKPQEILLGSESGGITLIDVPGIGEDPAHQKE